jgi:hypothetical protein
MFESPVPATSQQHAANNVVALPEEESSAVPGVSMLNPVDVIMQQEMEVAAGAGSSSANKAIVEPMQQAASPSATTWEAFDAVQISRCNDALLQGHYRQLPNFKISSQVIWGGGF